VTKNLLTPYGNNVDLQPSQAVVAVAKWLTQRIVIPPSVGSSPISHPLFKLLILLIKVKIIPNSSCDFKGYFCDRYTPFRK
jgi:hypothetical protein